MKVFAELFSKSDHKSDKMKGEPPTRVLPLSLQKQRNSPSPAFIERYGSFALCGGRQGLRALDLRRLLKKAGENFYALVCANIVVEPAMCAKNFPLEVFWRYLFFKKGSKQTKSILVIIGEEDLPDLTASVGISGGGM